MKVSNTSPSDGAAQPNLQKPRNTSPSALKMLKEQEPDTTVQSIDANKPKVEVSPSEDEKQEALAKNLTELKITSAVPETPGLVLNDIALDAADGLTQTLSSSTANRTPTSSDDVSQKADSNSELGTKPPSLDGKSITSGTTFNALDEKESLRPDDSASVKAAADEDDAFSVRGSLLINSRLGSDVAARVQRIQIGDMPPPVIVHTQQDPVVSGAITPHSSSSEQQHMMEARIQLATSTSTPGSLNGQNPDEKLLEAMKTQKDRIFLLRLENEVVNFVQNSKSVFAVFCLLVFVFRLFTVTNTQLQGAFHGLAAEQLVLPPAYPQAGRLLPYDALLRGCCRVRLCAHLPHTLLPRPTCPG